MRAPLYISLLALILIAGCSLEKKAARKRAPLLDAHTFKLNRISNDPTYGYSPNKPIKVGGVQYEEGPRNERRYLNALQGPNGESIDYERMGNCCAFTTPNGPLNHTGLLDKYKVTYEGMREDDYIILYLNMYDYGRVKAPLGFTYIEE